MLHILVIHIIQYLCLLLSRPRPAPDRAIIPVVLASALLALVVYCLCAVLCYYC